MTVIPAAGEAEAGRAKTQVLPGLYSKFKVSLSSFGETLSQNKTWDEGAGAYNCMEYLPSVCGVLGSISCIANMIFKDPMPPWWVWSNISFRFWCGFLCDQCWQILYHSDSSYFLPPLPRCVSTFNTNCNLKNQIVNEYPIPCSSHNGYYWGGRKNQVTMKSIRTACGSILCCLKIDTSI